MDPERKFRRGLDIPTKKRAERVTERQHKEERPVCLGLTGGDHEQLERCASSLGLNKASFARQAVFERIRADEQPGS
jgi:hypothetical protein